MGDDHAVGDLARESKCVRSIRREVNRDPGARRELQRRVGPGDRLTLEAEPLPRPEPADDVDRLAQSDRGTFERDAHLREADATGSVAEHGPAAG